MQERCGGSGGDRADTGEERSVGLVQNLELPEIRGAVDLHGWLRGDRTAAAAQYEFGPTAMTLDRVAAPHLGITEPAVSPIGAARKDAASDVLSEHWCPLQKVSVDLLDSGEGVAL